ncbi:MAG: hypothetical protein K6G53_05040 [Bacteroidales bacterium]|nr:hypothetical protein [Bacteroidales bacterium]
MKKTLLTCVLAIACILTAQAQRTPVKTHDFAFMGIEGGSGMNWFQLEDPYELSGAGFGNYYVGMHLEFLFGDRQQHGIITNEGIESFKGNIKCPTAFEGVAKASVINLFCKIGYKYSFRNTIFVEVFPQLDIPLTPKIITPANNTIERPTGEKTKVGFSLGVAVGKNFTDNLALVFRVKKSFTDFFDSDVFFPYMTKGGNKGNITAQMGIVIGFNL